MKKTKIVSIYTSKGGANKSSTTIMLASEMHYNNNKDVAILDFDSPQHTAKFFRNYNQEILKKNADLLDIESDLVSVWNEIGTFVETGRKFYPIEQISNFNDLMRGISLLSGKVDYIFLDLPGTLLEGVSDVFSNLDFLFVPMEVSAAYVKNLNDLGVLLEELKIGSFLKDNLVRNCFLINYSRNINPASMQAIIGLATKQVGPMLQNYVSDVPSVKEVQKLICSTINAIPKEYRLKNKESHLVKCIEEMAQILLKNE